MASAEDIQQRVLNRRIRVSHLLSVFPSITKVAETIGVGRSTAKQDIMWVVNHPSEVEFHDGTRPTVQVIEHYGGSVQANDSHDRNENLSSTHDGAPKDTITGKNNGVSEVVNDTVMARRVSVSMLMSQLKSKTLIAHTVHAGMPKVNTDIAWIANHPREITNHGGIAATLPVMKKYKVDGVLLPSVSPQHEDKTEDNSHDANNLASDGTTVSTGSNHEDGNTGDTGVVEHTDNEGTLDVVIQDMNDSPVGTTHASEQTSSVNNPSDDSSDGTTPESVDDVITEEVPMVEGDAPALDLVIGEAAGHGLLGVHTGEVTVDERVDNDFTDNQDVLSLDDNLERSGLDGVAQDGTGDEFVTVEDNELVTHVRDTADKLWNGRFTPDDEPESLWQAYKDVFKRILMRDDDLDDEDLKDWFFEGHDALAEVQKAGYDASEWGRWEYLEDKIRDDRVMITFLGFLVVLSLIIGIAGIVLLTMN